MWVLYLYLSLVLAIVGAGIRSANDDIVVLRGKELATSGGITLIWIIEGAVITVVIDIARPTSDERTTDVEVPGILNRKIESVFREAAWHRWRKKGAYIVAQDDRSRLEAYGFHASTPTRTDFHVSPTLKFINCVLDVFSDSRCPILSVTVLVAAQACLTALASDQWLETAGNGLSRWHISSDLYLSLLVATRNSFANDDIVACICKELATGSNVSVIRISDGPIITIIVDSICKIGNMTSTDGYTPGILDRKIKSA